MRLLMGVTWPTCAIFALADFFVRQSEEDLSIRVQIDDLAAEFGE